MTELETLATELARQTQRADTVTAALRDRGGRITELEAEIAAQKRYCEEVLGINAELRRRVSHAVTVLNGH